MKKNRRLALALAILLFGCGGGEEKKGDLAMEMAARKLAKKAEMFEKQENMVEAAKVYKELTDKFSETKFYAELEAKLEGKGISLKDPLASITSFSLFKLQNMLITYKEKNGHYPSPHALQIPKDVWGNSLVVEIPDMEAGRKFEFLVYSKGPDKKPKTNDDITVVYTGSKSDTVKFGDVKAEASTSSGSQKRAIKPGDKISLKELADIAQMKEKSAPAVERKPRKKVSLKKAKPASKAEPKKEKPKSGEIVKSLDELLEE